MEKILVLDFGGQYNQLIARRVREQHIYAEIRPFDRVTVRDILDAGYKGVIFTGGPNSVYDPASPHFDRAILDAGVPILGICYGCQLLAWLGGGEICTAGETSEYGKIRMTHTGGRLFDGVQETSVVWMSHTDYRVRRRDPAQLPVRRVRLRGRLADGRFCGAVRGLLPRKDREQKGAVRPVRRRGFRRVRRPAA